MAQAGGMLPAGAVKLLTLMALLDIDDLESEQVRPTRCHADVLLGISSSTCCSEIHSYKWVLSD